MNWRFAHAEQEYDKFHRQRQLETEKKRHSDFDKAVKSVNLMEKGKQTDNRPATLQKEF